MPRMVKRGRYADVAADELDSHLARGWLLVPEGAPGAKPAKKKKAKAKAKAKADS